MPDTATKPDLVPAAQDPRIPDLPDFAVHFGIPVAAIGEDGDMIALGHHTAKAVLAAFNAYAKSEFGLVDLLDSGRGSALEWRTALESVRHRWAVRLTDRCRTCARDGERADCWTCVDVREAARLNSWWLDFTAVEDELGAFPVTVWRC